jgi:predicted small secreted protein
LDRESLSTTLRLLELYLSSKQFALCNTALGFGEVI